MKIRVLLCLIFSCSCLNALEWEAVAREIRAFTAREIEAHFAAMGDLDAPQQRVLGASTHGEYSWGSFMRALAALAERKGGLTIADKDAAGAIGKIGVFEARGRARAFSQLYAAQALRAFGTDLKTNPVWQSLSCEEKEKWRSLLDPHRFYNEKKKTLIALPENYFGVAARLAAIRAQLGLCKNRAGLDALIDRAVAQFKEGALFADDLPPTGRFDRYSNEYARFCWDAAGLAGRKDVQALLKPSLKRQMALWWDLFSTKGMSYNWGRTQGLVSHLDVIEIAAFVSQYPEFRPASLTDIASAFYLAWVALQRDFDHKKHRYRIFARGRGGYGYMTADREWQQTLVALSKLVEAEQILTDVLRKANLKEIPLSPDLKNVARFEFFKKIEGNQSGVWVVREKDFAFALPLTTGPIPGIADYLPAPFGLAGLSAPVGSVYPCLVPFIQLADGNTYVASEGASKIQPGGDGKSLTVIWKEWGKLGSMSGRRFKNGLTSTVQFNVSGHKLIRRETLTAETDVEIALWKIALPISADEERCKITITGEWEMQKSVFRPGKGPLGRGICGAIKQYILYQARHLKLKAGQSLSWELSCYFSSSNL